MSTTLQAPPESTPTAAEPVVVTNEPPRSNVIGLVGLGLGILGFLLAIFLVTAGLAWMLLIPAIVLGVVGLILPKRRRGAALAAVIVGVIGLILSFVGFRLPAGSFGGQEETVLNNSGVNPFSVLTGPLPGQTIGQDNAVGGDTVTAGGSSGLEVTVSSVDCHQPLATVTGLNITGEVCAVTLIATNNGQNIVTIDSSNITADADGALLYADVNLAEGDSPLLDASILPGESSTGLVYVNVPSDSGGLDGIQVSVDTGDGDDDLIDVDLGGVGIGG